MTAAAADLANVGSAISVAHTAAAAPTVAVIPAAADEVSSSIANLFSRYAQDYQALAGRAAALHEQFVQRLTSNAGTYANAEVANVASLRPLAAAAGAVAASGAPSLNSLQLAVVLALGLATVPFYALMLSPFLLVVGLAIVIAPLLLFLYLLQQIPTLL
jgi:hypothetical protein